MSLLVAIYCAYSTFSWYWHNFIGFNHSYPWGILKGVGLSLLVGLLVHRAVWMLLDKIDSPFNHPPVLYTKMGRSEAISSIRGHLNKHGFFVNLTPLFAQDPKYKGYIETSKGISLADINDWRGGVLSSERAVEKIPGPLGSVFRFLGSATWYSGDFSVGLKVIIKVYGVDENYTLVKVSFENIASPPIINLWGPITRFMLFAKIKSLVNSSKDPQIMPTAEVVETDLPPKFQVDRSADYKLPQPPRDIKEFEKLWTDAKHGDAIAQFRVAEAYRLGGCVKQDYRKAIKTYEYAAERNNPDAQFALYELYRDHVINDPNEQKYLDLRRMAAEGGNPDAIYEIACWYMKTDQRFTAFEWFEKAAKLGHMNAMCYTANLLTEYKYTKFEKTDPRNADAWYLEAANRGSVTASLCLAHLRFKEGKFAIAFEQYRKAAMSGNVEAQLNLGFLYLYGDGVEQNLRRAKHWLSQAASQQSAGVDEYLQHAEEELAECLKLTA